MTSIFVYANHSPTFLSREVERGVLCRRLLFLENYCERDIVKLNRTRADWEACVRELIRTVRPQHLFDHVF